MITSDPYEGEPRSELLKKLRPALQNPVGEKEDLGFLEAGVSVVTGGLDRLAELATDAPPGAEEQLAVESPSHTRGDEAATPHHRLRSPPPRPTDLASYIVGKYFEQRSVLSYRARYNLACYCVSIDDFDSALVELRVSLEAGDLADLAKSDIALAPLRKAKRAEFSQVLADAQDGLAKAPKPHGDAPKRLSRNPRRRLRLPSRWPYRWR